MYGSIPGRSPLHQDGSNEQEHGATVPLLDPDRKRWFAHRREQKQQRKQFQNQGRGDSVFGGLFPSSTGKAKSKVRSREVPKKDQGGGPPASTAPVLAPPVAAPKKKKKKRHSFLYSLLNPHSKQWQAVMYKTFITAVILVDVVLFILSTDEILSAKYPDFFRNWEGTASCIFAVEYVCRMAVITEKEKFGRRGPFWGRLSYACTFEGLIDFASILPFFLELPTGWSLPTLTYLRIFRLFRILKTAGFVQAMDTVYRVIYYNGEILYVAALVCIFLVLVTAVLLYYFAPKRAKGESPVGFDSIGSTLYLATMMLTGQGGPEDPESLPWYTKMVVLLTSVFSVAMFAIPASMLTWGFEAEAERRAKQARKRAVRKAQCKSQENGQRSSLSSRCSSSTSSSLSEDEDTTDEEYFKIIAGEDDDDSEDQEESPTTRALRKHFESADVDADGTLTMKEFILQQKQALLKGSAGHDAAAIQELTAQLSTLQARVESNEQKLDRILQLLEGKASRRK